MTVCTLQSSKPPKALKQYHFSSGLVNAVLIVCSTCFEIFCSVLKINKKVTSVMHRHSIYRHKQYFLQSSHAYPHQGYITESKLSVGRIELVHALIYRGGNKALLSVVGEGTEIPFSFPNTGTLSFSISYLLILSTLLSAL